VFLVVALTWRPVPPHGPLTSTHAGLGRKLLLRYDVFYEEPSQMTRISQRDAEIVRLISRFGQLGAGHVQALVFSANASGTPCRRVLARLASIGYLHRVERRMAGGKGAGSGQYVYSLGPLGYRFMTPKGGKFTPQRTVKWHTLAIADAYVGMVTAGLELAGYATEPDSWRDVEGVKIRPDMHVELADGRVWWLEIDLGSESQRDLADKMNNILDAREKSGIYETTRPDGSTFREVVGLVPFPRVIFIVPDKYRADEIRWVMKRLGDDAAELFDVVAVDNFPHSVL